MSGTVPRKVHTVIEHDDGPVTGYMIFCPACKSGHLFNTTPGDNGAGGRKPVWDFDGNLDCPTFSPSMLSKGVRFTAKGRADYDEWVKAGRPMPAGNFENEPIVCHSFVRGGRIEFLADCTHEMAGTTVDLPEF